MFQIGQDVVAVNLTKIKSPPDLPPVGPVVWKKLYVDDLVYVVKENFKSNWILSRITEIVSNKTKTDVNDVSVGEALVVECVLVSDGSRRGSVRSRTCKTSSKPTTSWPYFTTQVKS